MANTKTWPDPDTQFAEQGRSDVHGTYILSPTTNKPIDPTQVTVNASVDGSNAAGYVALTSPPTATNAGSDTSLTFSQQVNNVIIENNTSANVYYAFDTAATLGSLVLVPGTYYEKPKKVTVLHLLTAAAQNINGTAVGGIAVLGEL